MNLKRAEFVEDAWCQYRMKHPFLNWRVFLDAQELYCTLFDQEEKRDVEYYGEGFKDELLAAFRYFRKKHMNKETPKQCEAIAQAWEETSKWKTDPEGTSAGMTKDDTNLCQHGDDTR